jgi:hypothetical protein
MPEQMTPRQRMLASFSREPVDCFPVTVPYLMLLQADLWSAITRQPTWTYYQWMLQPPEAHIQEFHRFHDLLPFDISQPEIAREQSERPHLRIVPGEQAGAWYELDTRSGKRHELVLDLHHKDTAHAWSRRIFSLKDIPEQIAVIPASELIGSGRYDYFKAHANAFGKERFMAGTVVNAFYAVTWYTGLMERFYLLHDEPELVHGMLERLTLRHIEEIRALAWAGCDAVYIDDATASKDMISREMYLEFCQPYLRRHIAEIQKLGMRAIVIYFGGIDDRVEPIVASGADGLLMETSMKGYTNDLETIAAQVNDRMLLFGNLDPVADLEQATDEELICKIQAQIAIGKQYGRLVISTGSPVTPETSLTRVQNFITWGHSLTAF